jgi:hypothetical protein
MRKAERRNAKMINVERIEVFNWEGAIRGMRNPLNSWEKSDSNFSCRDCEDCYYGGMSNHEDEEDGSTTNLCDHTALRIGENDLALMKKLVRAGSDERKFMRQILVSMDITAPFYWWKECDTYKVGTTANSCSTMHRIHSKRLELDDFSCESLDVEGKKLLEAVIAYINFNIKMFDETKEKSYWKNIIQMLPTSYNQKRTLTLNYEVLRNMYHARKHHKLAEWRELCEVIEGLPYSELITMEAKVAK